MTDEQRKALAREESKAIVSWLRESNEQAARRGAPAVGEKQYRALQGVLTRKLQRR